MLRVVSASIERDGLRDDLAGQGFDGDMLVVVVIVDLDDDALGRGADLDVVVLDAAMLSATSTRWGRTR